MRYRASIVIPAHNESSVIGSCLDLVMAEASDAYQIVVVCNGCDDNTAEVARGRGASVVEIPQASKAAALNAGDGAATVFPRVYLDADIELTPASLRAIIDEFAHGAVAVGAVPRVDLDGCGWSVRAYYAIWSRLGYVTTQTLGSGLYALSESGRSRFGEFPDVISDDGYVYHHFAPSERMNPPGATFVIRAPRTVRSLLQRRIRIVTGNMQLAAGGHVIVQSPPGPGWREVVRARPQLFPAAVVYTVVNLLGALAARRRIRSGQPGSWNQDRTTRVQS